MTLALLDRLKCSQQVGDLSWNDFVSSSVIHGTTIILFIIFSSDSFTNHKFNWIKIHLQIQETPILPAGNNTVKQSQSVELGKNTTLVPMFVKKKHLPGISLSAPFHGGLEHRWIFYMQTVWGLSCNLWLSLPGARETHRDQI